MPSKGHCDGKMKMVYTTAKKKDAMPIAEKLLNERLAGCVNMFPVQSMYWWKGRIEKDSEVGMLIKVKDAKKAVKRIKDLHPYELPAILVFDVKGYAPFARWIEKVCK